MRPVERTQFWRTVSSAICSEPDAEDEQMHANI